MRRAKVDANQPGIVAEFRRLGCSVLHLHMVGHGCPDIAIGKRHKTILVEIKDGSKPPSAKRLTEDEQKFHEEWEGSISIVESVEDVREMLIFHGLIES